MNAIVTYFDSSRVEHIPKEIKKFIKGSPVTSNFFRIQTYDSAMCAYFCIGFHDFMLKGKSLTDFINLFFTKSFEKNGDIILNYFLTVL